MSVPTNIQILALTLGLMSSALGDPQIPAKPLAPPPATATASASATANDTSSSSTKNSASHEISFVAGTPIFTEEGRKLAENVTAGERVWATDLKTRKSGYQTVTHVSTHEADEIIQLLTDSREEIEATPAALFWVNTKGWVEAKSLFPGEQLLQRDGTFTRVFNVIPKHVPETKVYSFEVEDFHNRLRFLLRHAGARLG